MVEEAEVSWRDVTAHCPVIASDGKQVGHVLEVAALPNEDIFHGIVFEHHVLGHAYLAPAADVGRITERAVHLSVDSTAADAYERFQPLHIERLGLKGRFFWRHLGWTDSPE
jgi:hypothetical protein